MTDALSRLDIMDAAVSGVLCLLALVASMLMWRSLLAAVGQPLGLVTAARLYFLTQIGKYLPGSVWPVVAQIELGRERGVPAHLSGLAAAMNLLLGIASGIVVGLGCLLASTGSVGEYWWLLLPLAALLVLLHPRALRLAVSTLLRLTRRPVVDVEVRASGMLAAGGWSLVMWALFGLHIHVLVASLPGGGDLLRSVGAYALAWVAGFLVFFAPAGAGARELTLVVLLAPPLGRPEALAVAVVSRVIGVAGDLVVAGAAVLAERWHRRTTADTGQVADESPGGRR